MPPKRIPKPKAKPKNKHNKRQQPTRSQIVRPPIPDLRFEQSYLRSIAPAKGNWLWVAILSLRDQLVMPLTQGFLWALAVTGYRAWAQYAAANGQAWGRMYPSFSSRLFPY